MKEGEVRTQTHFFKGLKVQILAVFLLFPKVWFAGDLFLTNPVTEGFRDLKWNTGLEEALKEIPGLYFDHYSLPAGDKTPSKICYRKNEDRKIGRVNFSEIEYWFKEDYFYKVAAHAYSHYGPRTLVTEAERDFEELRKKIGLQYGEPIDHKTEFGLTHFDKRAAWRVRRAIILLLYKEGVKPNTSELYLEINNE
jgi:hypothetical protein